MTHYVPLGIDHGTTNSSIAIMEGSQPRVLKPDSNDAVMPSAVYVRKDGRLLVGRPAYEAMTIGNERDGNGYTRYKPNIGQDSRYEFQAAKLVMSAPELGATVIKELLGAYRSAFPALQPKSCVITVPAKFGTQDLEATRDAARKAGLLHYPTLQEPIAAAIAYGLRRTDARAQWLVFDLGGGTLDVTVVATRDHELVVLGHEGDNTLGGGNFDRKLLDDVLVQLRQQYALSNFTPSNPKYSSAWGVLSLAVEAAKIALSDRTEALVEVKGALPGPGGAPCKDDNGREVRVEVPITRARYEQLIGPLVEKAVHCCEMLLNNQRLRPSDVDRLILIGGPSKTPYIQSVLASRLKIRLESSIDPMTAVAQGAAIHASTVEIPREVFVQCTTVSTPTRGATVDLFYDRSSSLPSVQIGGTIQPPVPGCTVEFRRADAAWTSGKLRVEIDGTFFGELLLAQRGSPFQSCFRCVVCGPDGRELASLDEPRVWHPPPSTQPRLANSLRVGVSGDRTHILVKQGEPLPTKSQVEKFVTVKSLRRGSNADLLSIPVYEGVTHLFGEESERMNAADLVGVLAIKGDDSKVTCDLPTGCDVEVTLQETDSQEITATAYIPLLDDEFTVTFSTQARKVDIPALSDRVEQLATSLSEIRQLNASEALPAVTKCLSDLDRMDVINDIRSDLARAKDGETEAAHRAHKRVLELAGAVDFIRDRQRQVWVEHKVRTLEKQVNGDERKDLQAIEQVRSGADEQSLRKVEEELRALDWRVRARPYFDVLIDLQALDGFKANSLQIDAFRNAERLVKGIDERGGYKTATERELSELRAVHEKLLAVFGGELNARREKFLQDLAMQGGSVTDVQRSDVKKAV